MRRILEHYSSHKKIRLLIGDGGIFMQPSIVTTVLGSCVSVTFHCRTKRIGATFHAVFPAMTDKEKNNLSFNHFKYVDSSISHILHLFHKIGVRPHQIEAKLFGGAQSFDNELIQTGANNIVSAYEILAANKIRIMASDVGGATGRNLLFVTDTGEVFIKNHKKNCLRNMKNASIIKPQRKQLRASL